MIYCTPTPYNPRSISCYFKVNNTYPKHLRIIKIICICLNVKEAEITSKERGKQDVSDARMIAVYFIKKHTTLSQSRIGQLFGDRDHSTISYNVDVVNELINTTNKKFMPKFDKCQYAINKNLEGHGT